MKLELNPRIQNPKSQFYSIPVEYVDNLYYVLDKVVHILRSANHYPNQNNSLSMEMWCGVVSRTAEESHIGVNCIICRIKAKRAGVIP